MTNHSNLPLKSQRVVDRFHMDLLQITKLLHGQERAANFALNSKAEKISTWSVGDHCDHTLLVARRILESVRENQEVAGPPLKLMGRVVLATRFIPRGKAKSPASVLPQARERELLEAELETVRAVLAQIVSSVELLRSKKRVFQHPMLGAMTASEALEFAEIHTRHHLRIVRDIVKALQ